MTDKKNVLFLTEIVDAEYLMDVDENGNNYPEDTEEERYGELSNGSVTLGWKEVSSDAEIEEHKQLLAKNYRLNKENIWHVVAQSS
jgi:hypothetical protein